MDRETKIRLITEAVGSDKWLKLNPPHIHKIDIYNHPYFEILDRNIRPTCIGIDEFYFLDPPTPKQVEKIYQERMQSFNQAMANILEPEEKIKNFINTHL